MLPPVRAVLGARYLALALGLLAALGGLAGCGDADANPIVRAVPAADAGFDAAGPGDPGDLCAPCGSRADCDSDESCVELSRGGERFCSHACGGGNGRCPPGYVCSDVYNVVSLECVPDTGACDGVVF